MTMIGYLHSIEFDTPDSYQSYRVRRGKTKYKVKGNKS